MMIQCVECGYESNEFDLCIGGIFRGVLTYMVKCPLCGSKKVKFFAGCYEGNLKVCVKQEALSVTRGNDKDLINLLTD